MQYGLLLFMLAAGLTLIFGIMGVVNLAHGSFYMLGAYLAWSLAAKTGSLMLAIVLGTALSVLFGLLLERCCSGSSTTATTWTRCCSPSA